MQKVLTISIVAIFGSVIAYVALERSKIAAKVFDIRVEWSTYESSTKPAEDFARLVDESISTSLIDKFEIDVTEGAIRAYMARHAPELFSDTQLRDDQNVTRNIVSALDSVFSDGKSPEAAYQHHRLDERMTFERWNQIVQTSTDKSIEAMRRFSKANTENLSKNSVESMRWIYVARMLRERICTLPDVREAIQTRLSKNIGSDQDDPLLNNPSVYEYECTVEVNSFIRKVVSDHVVIFRDEIRGFERHLQLLDHMVGT